MAVEVENLDYYADKYHANAVDKGFYSGRVNPYTLLLLIISELAEAIEADRKGNHVDSHQVQYLIENVHANPELLLDVKDSFEFELADAMIRMLDMFGYIKSIGVDAADSKYVTVSSRYAFTKSICDDFYYLMPEDELFTQESLLLKIISILSGSDDTETYASILSKAIYLLDALASDICQFNIWKCMELKHAYNITRGYKHGKLY